ncbi:extracellular solute-binding protein [Alkalicoccobacillus porphyridii]|uniref:Extracellular solute-binding protein n=1 Tax=Alkalicoccobacillus porphyridii TaxID=2597270 RepID=A0A554A498_9BACI|nr:extracellular solute-binding protein [Alkalicoccobacillus porphyridii]TSB48495.1 extracellular solute-binding protein [Alkalicoccobacillus porphyridii]
MRGKVCIYVLIILILSSCQVQESKDVLYIYAGMDDAHAIKAFEQFERDTGIQVVFKRLSNGKILQLLEEGETKIDVWYGGPSVLFEEAKREGLLMPYRSEKRKDIDPLYYDADGNWTGVYVSVLALVANRQWHLEQGVELPKRWTDLQRVEYKGWLTLPDPRITGTGYLTLTMLHQLYGESRTRSVVENIDTNVSDYASTGISPGRVIGSKKGAATIMFAHDAMRLKHEGYNELVIIYPTEPTMYEVGAVAISQTTKNPEQAKLFVDWALSIEAQEIGKRVGSYQYLTNHSAIQPEQAIDPADLLVIDPDHAQSSTERQNWISQFQEWTKVDN